MWILFRSIHSLYKLYGASPHFDLRSYFVVWCSFHLYQEKKLKARFINSTDGYHQRHEVYDIRRMTLVQKKSYWRQCIKLMSLSFILQTCHLEKGITFIIHGNSSKISLNNNNIVRGACQHPEALLASNETRISMSSQFPGFT